MSEINLWHSSDFENKEDFIARVERNEVKVGDHFEGTVGKTIDNGAFIHIAHDSNSRDGWFDGFIPLRELSWDSVSTVESILVEGMKVETVIKNFRFQDREGNYKFSVTLSLRDVTPREKPQDNSLNLDAEYSEDFDPIDTSTIEAEGIYQIQITPVAEDKENIYNYLITNMKYLDNEISRLREIEIQERCPFILNGIFKTDFNSQVYLRNISMDDNLHVGIRCKRFPGDWIDTELGISTKETLLIEGAFINRNRAISVSQICVVANIEECLPYEIECEIMPQNEGIQVRDIRLRNIVAKIPSLYKTTADQLKLWEDYLNWRKTLVETQLIGCKYIDRYYDPTLKQIVFTLIAKDKEFYNSIRGKLRDGVQAYSNNYSEKDWSFSLNRDVRIRNVKREKLGRRGKVIAEFYLDKKEINIDDKEDSIVTDLLKTIPNPYVIKVPYSLGPQAKQYLDDNELSEDETEKYIKENVLSDFPKEGFIALSAAGDFILIRRLQRAIDQLKRGENYSPRLCNWMFDSKNARPLENKVQEIEWKNKNIENNEFQKNAVLGILNAPDLFLLQGPPGTGKTTVIAEAIYQLIKQNKRVLLSSQSNDAVDEALDRLANDPNIRALRIGRKSKPKNKRDDDNVNKFSEETALSEFYKSISVQIKDEMLSDWENADILKNQYALDLRDLKNFSSDLTDLVNENHELDRQYEVLYKQKAETESKIKELTQSTLDSQNDRLQLSNFKSFLREQPDITFYLSKVQINAIQSIIINIISSCNTNGINLLPRALDSNVLTPKDYSIYLKVLITNYKRVCELEKKLTNRGEGTKGNDPELLVIQQQLNIIDQKMSDPSITDEEFTKLTSRQNKLMLERRKLSSSNNTANILSGYEDLLIAPSAEIDNLITGIKIVSKNYTNFISEIEKNLDDLAKNDSSYDELRFLKNEKDSTDGRIKVCTEEINQKREEIQNKRNTLHKLCEKYGLPKNSSEDFIAGKINELQHQNEKKISDSYEVKTFWGDTLKSFARRLDTASKNEKEMWYENEIYLKRYIKACNVVGISCTADPKFLEDNEFTDFDVVIIDEVSKATPPELLLSLMKGRKTVLVGDHRQLPPTFGEHEGSFQTFAEQVQESDEYDDSVKAIMTMDYLKKYKDMVTSSLFKKHFDNPEMDVRLKGSLRYQYRMHSDIMKIVNNFYPGEEKLIAGWKPEEENGPVKYDENHKMISGIKNHLLRIGTETVPNFITPEKHAYWIDSSKTPSNKPNFATTRGTSTSICNLLEQKMTLNLLDLIDKKYVEMGFPEKNLDEKGRPHKISVGVICLYQLQVNDLRDKLYEIKKNPKRKYKAIDVTCNTIDRFQGQEKEIIIVNLVCNKPINTLRGPRGSEHITSYERINVAFSRAQKLLVIMGAQEYFKEINVALPTENNSVVTRQIYKDIYSELNRRGCFFGSSSLISKQDEIDIEKESQEIINEKKELEEEKNQPNNRRKRGY